MYRLRFIVIMLRCLLSKPGSIMESYEMSLRALPVADADVTRLFTQTYMAWTGLGRWHYVFSSGFKNAALKHRWIPVTTAETITFRKSIKIGEKVQLTTQILGWNERCFFLKQIFTVKGEVRATAYSEGIVRGPKGHLKPGEIFTYLGGPLQSPEIPAEVQKWYSMREKSKNAESSGQALRLES